MKNKSSEIYITKIKEFFVELKSKFGDLNGYHTLYAFVVYAINALSAIEKNSSFEPLVNKWYVMEDLYLNFPIQNAYDYLSIIMTEPVMCNIRKWEDLKVEKKFTFFQYLLMEKGTLGSNFVKQFPQIFYMVRALADSSYILAGKGKLPPNVAFHLTREMSKSLYDHVICLGWGSKIKSLDNTKDNKPTLLTTTLGLLEEKVNDIQSYRSFNGFSLIPEDRSTGIRLFNYHKRAVPLTILCNHINESKSFNPLKWFSREKPKALKTRLLNTPYSSVNEYLLIDEIEKLISSGTIRDPKYKKTLEQVRDALVKNSRCEPLSR